jgi:hypothetical protein
VESGVLRDPRLFEERFPVFPVDVRVGGAAIRLAPDQVPVLPGGAGRLALGVLVLEVLEQHRDERTRDGNGPLPAAFRAGKPPAAFSLGAGFRMAPAVGRTELRALPAVLGAAGRARPLLSLVISLQRLKG